MNSLSWIEDQAEINVPAPLTALIGRDCLPTLSSAEQSGIKLPHSRTSLQNFPEASMRQPFTFLCMLFTFVSFSVCSASQAQTAEASTGRTYHLKISANMKILPPEHIKEQPVELETLARIEYLIARNENREEISIHSEAMTEKQKGQLVQETLMSRKVFRGSPTRGVPATEISFDNAPLPLQQALLSYDTPILSITMDPTGKETARRPLARGQLAKHLTELVETILSIHAPFSETETTWKVPAKLAMAQGNAATGTLTFEKPGPDATPNAPKKVKVSGELKAAGTIGQAKVKNGRYVIQGEQTYDPISKVWKAAHWQIALSMELTDLQDQPFGTSSGNLELVMAAIEPATPVVKPVAPAAAPSVKATVTSPHSTPPASKTIAPATKPAAPAVKPARN